MKDFNLERAQKAAQQLLKTTSFEDQMWIFRNITYDQIKYFSENDKGIVYDGEHSQDCIYQATNLQRQISTCTDLFTQSIVNKTVFNENYLKQYDFAGPYLATIQTLKDQISALRQEMQNINELLQTK